MEFSHVSVEAHRTGATIYIAGWLAAPAAHDTEQVLRHLRHGTAMLRLDLQAVDIIEPASFLRVARALNYWRDARRARVHIRFPERAVRRMQRVG